VVHDVAALLTAMARGPGAPLRLCALALALVACAPAEDAIDAARLLSDLSGSVSADGVAVREIEWTSRGLRRVADLYVPEREEAALVLAPGLGRDGRRDARLTAFAASLARVGYVVLVPDVPNFQAQRVAAGDSEILADAARHLLARQGEESRVGIAAVSYAVGPAVIAALEPDIAPRVNVVAAIGGYYDTRAVVTFFTTGFFRAEPTAAWQHRVPNAYGKWVFVLANAERIADARDRTSLHAMARRKLADLDADIEDLRAGLGAEGRAVVDLLANADPDRVPALIAALPQAVREDLDGLDLARRDLGALRARLVLIHGRDDAIIPYVESVALARAVRPGQAHLALLDSLAHADLGPGGLTDAVRLWRAAYAMLRLRHQGTDRDGRSDPIN
jgi:pimeloyl-ACP methyl ester carboxylesterase